MVLYISQKKIKSSFYISKSKLLTFIKENLIILYILKEIFMKYNIRNMLKSLADERYQKFASSLLPNISNVLGVRIPILRKKAKEITKNEKDFVWPDKLLFMEEIVLKGMIIGLQTKDMNNWKEVEKFVELIDNWSVCASFCCGLKFVKQNKSAVWEKIQIYLASDKEYYQRFALVILINFFVEEDYITKILDKTRLVDSDKYYVQMAAAWLLAECFVKFRNQTWDYLAKADINDVIYDKAIKNIVESTRVDLPTKNEIKKLKLKKKLL